MWASLFAVFLVQLTASPGFALREKSFYPKGDAATVGDLPLRFFDNRELRGDTKFELNKQGFFEGQKKLCEWEGDGGPKPERRDKPTGLKCTEKFPIEVAQTGIFEPSTATEPPTHPVFRLVVWVKVISPGVAQTEFRGKPYWFKKETGIILSRETQVKQSKELAQDKAFASFVQAIKACLQTGDAECLARHSASTIKARPITYSGALFLHDSRYECPKLARKEPLSISEKESIADEPCPAHLKVCIDVLDQDESEPLKTFRCFFAAIKAGEEREVENRNEYLKALSHPLEFPFLSVTLAREPSDDLEATLEANPKEYSHYLGFKLHNGKWLIHEVSATNPD